MKFLFKRSVVFELLIFIQLAVLALILIRMADNFAYAYAGLMLISVSVVLWLTNSNDPPAYKLAWTTITVAFPLVGGAFYALFGTSKLSSRLKKKFEFLPKYKESAAKLCVTTDTPEDNLNITYLKNVSFPVFQNAGVKYTQSGEDNFREMLECLKSAKKYIFLEYFIIEEGMMWNTILDVLTEKVREGLTVRVIYDDCGSLGLLPANYSAELSKKGIDCRVFNPFVPSLSITMNNRDHRKFTVIDGETAFTGGVNLADEYINEKKVHGHWKDSGIMFKGGAVITALALFLETWNLIKPTDNGIEPFLPDKMENMEKREKHFSNNGYIQVYGTGPYDCDTVGENIYLNMITKAKKEISIMTPYLIVGYELTSALCLAAKSGVKVRIITPGIGDKWFVHQLTRSSYLVLVEAGVEIYEYVPGFIHSKIVVCDGETASVGTINFDYRSLYLHFECGVMLYNCDEIEKIIFDFEDTFAKSRQITLDVCKSVKWYKRLARGVLKLFAPLM
jgi:cardiolipin synthase